MLLVDMHICMDFLKLSLISCKGKKYSPLFLPSFWNGWYLPCTFYIYKLRSPKPNIFISSDFRRCPFWMSCKSGFALCETLYWYHWSWFPPFWILWGLVGTYLLSFIFMLGGTFCFPTPCLFLVIIQFPSTPFLDSDWMMRAFHFLMSSL